MTFKVVPVVVVERVIFVPETSDVTPVFVMVPKLDEVETAMPVPAAIL